MSAMALPSADLSDELPQVRGSLEFNAPLGEKLWFGTGGGADILFKPKDEADLQDFLKAKPAHIPHITIGAGSNVIIRQSGIRGIVIRLRKGFADISSDGDKLTAGAGAADMNVAKAARQASLSGAEFLAGIPGSIGGAIKMNAGANLAECKDILSACRVVDEKGRLTILSADDLDYAYRSSNLRDDWVVLSAEFHLQKASAEAIDGKMAAVKDHRLDAQPVKGKTGGSTFKNPPDAKAWELIDQAGCRGLKVGGAYMSEKHCNFMFNDGSATAADLEALGEAVRARVLQKCGVSLEWEIKRLGENLGEEHGE